MKLVFNRLTKETGQSGDLSQTERMIMQVMRHDKDIVGEEVGSSDHGLKVTGEYDEYVISNMYKYV